MARPQNEDERSPSNVPALRYVEVYAIDSNPTQPVQVKLLMWNGSAYVAYGSPFRIGTAETKLTFHTNGDRLWVIWRSDSKHWEPLADVENYRLIRGQSYGVQSGATILLRNIVVLAGGVDPTNGNPTTLVRVANIFGAAFTDGQFVDAAYSRGVSVVPPADWETLAGGGGSEKFRAIRAIAYSAANASTTTFLANNIELLAGSLDPRSSPGDTSETITIHKLGKEVINVGDAITAIYDVHLGQWELLVCERFRSLRGKCYSQSGHTLLVDHIWSLEGGLDPRMNPANDLEAIAVDVVNLDVFVNGNDVYADWNARRGLFEARPKAAGGGGGYYCTLDADIAQGNGATHAMTSGTGTVYTTTGSTIASGAKIWNPSNCTMPQLSADGGYTAQYACVAAASGDGYIITGPDLLPVLSALPGFAELTALYTPDGTAAGIQWGGATC